MGHARALVGALAVATLCAAFADRAVAASNGVIVVSANRLPPGQSGLFVIDGAAPPRRLTTGEDYAPAFSPDGRQVAFSRYRIDGPLPSLFVVGIEGGEPRPLPVPGRGGYPAWSPDGRSLAFARLRRRTREVWTARLDGTGRRRLGYGDQPSWSPDGRRIAYVAPSRGCRSIFTSRPDGGDRRRLVRMAPPTARCTEPWFKYPVTRNPYSVFSPDWSPDGRRMAFGNGRRLIVREVGSGRMRSIRSRAGVPVDVDFSPDGRFLLYGGGRRTVVQALAGGGGRRIGPGPSAAWQPR